MISLKKTLSYMIRLSVIVGIVLIAKSSSSFIEMKVSNDASNRIINLSTMAMKLEEDIKNDLYRSQDNFTGDLTGYGADCPLCGGTLACMPSYYVKDGTDTYHDPLYGTVRIVASSKNLPCGSIVRFEVNSISSEPIIAIVLDRGVLGNDLDLLTPSEEYALHNVGRHKITYDVLRQGWTR